MLSFLLLAESGLNITVIWFLKKKIISFKAIHKPLTQKTRVLIPIRDEKLINELKVRDLISSPSHEVTNKILHAISQIRVRSLGG